MDRRTLLIALAATVPLAATRGWEANAGTTRRPASGFSPEAHARNVEALRPPKRSRPLVAVVLEKRGSETTDTLIPYGVLSASGAAEVELVCENAQPVELFPALTVLPTVTFADFDARHPQGADYVIVPASHRVDDPVLVGWVQAQYETGAHMVGICAGAKTLGAARLLDGRRGTTHWYELEGLRRIAPDMQWVADRRYVVDGTITTTTGVTASIPVSLAIVEAIRGRGEAALLAERLGVANWSAEHDSEAFSVSREAVTTALTGRLAFWNRRRIGVPVASGVDEIALALTADAWSRTYRSAAYAVSEETLPVGRYGARFVPSSTGAGPYELLDPPRSDLPARALEDALAGIAVRYGEEVARFVALQLEYPLVG